jgi:hypothetical protein
MREIIWIAGMGYFGLRALRKLSLQHKERQFVLIDPVTPNIEAAEGTNCRFEQTDAVAYLEHSLRPGAGMPDWIIPALPLHLAAEWCQRRIRSQRFRRKLSLPLGLDLRLPNPLRGNAGDIYVSHAVFRCPEECSEPRDICTVTRSVRKQNMFELLQLLRFPLFESLVIRSHQLAAGVGGYRSAQLFTLLHQVDKAKGNVLISTACRCHGVMTGLENQFPVP